ncbi:helix-turn-helix domain-containing protein [Halodesulfovibrio marinisediminis]|uniref:AraC-type DNA-binding protein n=1 Tax=Halodesulfovibrio marinisediminis DSM 17456 TaxID=1121457 RepID=A0A1N6FLH1_9BACT|nr:helix-turn-helix domain-containing protein [Halodesulfovibrio marinisediminis]SIN96095.1 AraC-type DNA-binding protein [Halodesulfovibrio marinisediminis DSM 17456]
MTQIPHISFRIKTNSKLEFEIVTLKELFSRQKYIQNDLKLPHRINFYHILFITKGTGTHHIDFTPYDLCKGSVLFIAPSQVHAFEINDALDGFLILFTEQFILKNLGQTDFASLARTYNYHSRSPLVEGTSADKKELLQTFKKIHDEFMQPADLATEEILRLQLKLLLLKVERITQTLPADSHDSDWSNLFTLFRRQVKNSYTETRNAADYAAMLNISYKHLNTICKAMAGKTAKEFIDTYVVLEIKRQLSMFTISTKELAFQIGFDEPTNLVKFFKKHTRYTPQQFKTAFLS